MSRGSPFEEYKALYQERFEALKKESPDVTELDFIVEEIDNALWTIHCYENQEDIQELDADIYRTTPIPTKSEYHTALRIYEYLSQRRDSLIDNTPNLVQANNKSERNSHRITLLRQKYLVDAGLKEQWTAKEMRNMSQKLYEASFSFLKNSKTRPYRPPTKEELEVVIELLKDTPKARELAIADLRRINE